MCSSRKNIKDGKADSQHTPPQETRQYRRVTNAQKIELTELFRKNGDDKPVEWYSLQVGVRLSRTRDLLSKLRNGQSVMPRGHYHRRSRVEPFQRLIAWGLTKKPTISINSLRESLQTLVDECGAVSEDDVLAIDPERLDRFLDDESQRQEEQVDRGGLSLNINFNATETSTLEDTNVNEVSSLEIGG